MTTRILPAIALLCVALAVGACSAGTGSDPEASAATAPGADASLARTRVRDFLLQYRALRFSGLPDASRLQALAPHLSPRLGGLMARARVGQQAYLERYPSDKPPLIEGDLFSSLFEGPTGMAVGPGLREGERMVVPVRYAYLDPERPANDITWTDRFVLVRDPSGAGWLIDDVAYGGGWDFAIKGRLSAALLETAALR